MLRKSVSVVSAVVVVASSLVFTGCSTTLKSNTIQSVALKPNVHSSLTYADLDVSEKKVVGKASGQMPLSTKASLEKEAVTNAVAQREGADVLVGATFFYEQTGRALSVTVTGFPAYYKNFRAYTPDSGARFVETAVYVPASAGHAPVVPAPSVPAPAVPAHAVEE